MRLSAKEILLFTLASMHTMDENNDIKETRWNRFLYKMSCKVAGGKEKLDSMSSEIMNKILPYMKD